MNNNEWLDHSSVYGQQKNKFYRWILYPTIVLFIFIALFLVFAKREIVIKTTAKIVSEKSTKLQTPSDFRIKENNLLENKEVKKGETLVSFDMSQAHIEKELLETENSDIELQKKSAQIFIDSINQNQNLFENKTQYARGFCSFTLAASRKDTSSSFKSLIASVTSLLCSSLY